MCTHMVGNDEIICELQEGERERKERKSTGFSQHCSNTHIGQEFDIIFVSGFKITMFSRRREVSMF